MLTKVYAASMVTALLVTRFLLIPIGIALLLTSLVNPPALDAQQFQKTHSDTPALGHSRPLVVDTRSETTDPKLEVARDTFRRSLIKAAQTAAGKGTIDRRDVITIRIATFSPAFLERAEELCVVQMAFSEDADELPRTETGDVDRTAIDWEGFAAFLERFIPLLLTLRKAFGI